jgi:hypothetical protein
VGLVYVLAASAGSWLHTGVGAPLLDGIAPPVRYQWVSPPPALSAGNRQPQAQRFTISMGKNGSDPQVISTSDLQATVVLGPGVIPPHAGSSSVALEVTPLAPSSLGPAPAGLAVAGNVYRFSAAYAGDGAVGQFRRAVPVTLVYPATPSTGHVAHEVIYSTDGKGWKKLPTRDNRTGQLALAQIEGFGYVAVVLPASAADGLLPSSAPTSAPSGSSSGLPFAFAAAAVLAVVAVMLVLRRRRYRGFHRRGS